MTFPLNDPEVFQRIDWRLLQNGSITMYYRPELLAEDAGRLEMLGYRLDNFNCLEWDNEEIMFEQLIDKLKLEECYAHNLGALNDGLAEMEVQEGGRVIVFHRYDAFAAKAPELAQALLDIIESNSRMHLLFGRRLITLLQSNEPRISFEPVGGRPVMWNRREGLNSSRGL